MCDLSKMLLAWIDGELTADNAAKLERHLPTCDECRSRAEEYRRVSRSFEEYCDVYGKTLAVSRPQREFNHLLPRGSAAMAITAIVVLLVLFSPIVRVPQFPSRAPTPAQPVQTAQLATKPAQPGATCLPTAPPQRRRSRPLAKQEPRPVLSAAQTQPRQLNTLLGAPAVEIAIPADDLFPPGAVPPGVVFTADVTIVPESSAQQISLRPQLARFERRLTQP